MIPILEQSLLPRNAQVRRQAHEEEREAPARRRPHEINAFDIVVVHVLLRWDA